MTAPTTGFSDAAAKWNQRFEHEGYLFGTEPNVYLRTQAPRLPASGRALCVADGEGRNSVWLAQQGLVVDAFDVADRAVQKAQALARQAGVQVNHTVADCDGFAWPEAAYDAVAAIFVQFADPALRTRLFQRMVASLKPGGLLILQGYTPRQLDYRTGGPPILSHLYTADLLRTAFAGLTFITLSEYEADVQEGTGHSGRSALIGLVARR